MNISNKTQRPLRVPLPGGKMLFLGPGRTAQVSPKAMRHPPLVALVEAGDVESREEGRTTRTSAGRKSRGVSFAEGHDSGGGFRHTGDR